METVKWRTACGTAGIGEGAMGGDEKLYTCLAYVSGAAVIKELQNLPSQCIAKTRVNNFPAAQPCTTLTKPVLQVDQLSQ